MPNKICDSDASANLVNETIEKEDYIAIVDVSFENFEWTQIIEDLTFEQCHFIGVSFKCDEILSTRFLSCVFTNCKFNGQKVHESIFKQCQFYDAITEVSSSFAYCDLSASEFHHCDLSMCNLSRSSIYRTEFHHCQTQGIDLSHCSSESNIGGRVSLYSAKFVDCNLSYADLSGANLSSTEFIDSRLSHA
ncbi:MAG: fluoroquinolone resistance protein, partial [Candidatus Azotimanducaceae bacterium]